MARSRTTTSEAQPPEANEAAPSNGTAPAKEAVDTRPPIETALESCRRSRTKAKRHGDHRVAAIMLRAEAALIELEAQREDQQDMFANMKATEALP